METMGQVFKAARERKRISLSTAAARTRIKIQHLEAMERDDFSKMPAPTYARGFIRMYADFLGLDPAPLIDEYNRLHDPTAREKAPSARKSVPKPSPRREPETVRESTADEMVSAPPQESRAQRLPQISLKAVPKSVWRAIGIALAAVAVVWGLGMAVRRCSAEQPAQKSLPPVRRPAPPLVEEPPDPYLPVPRAPGATP